MHVRINLVKPKVKFLLKISVLILNVKILIKDYHLILNILKRENGLVNHVGQITVQNVGKKKSKEVKCT